MVLNSFHLPGSKDKDEQLTFARIEELTRKAENVSHSIIRIPLQTHLTRHLPTQDLIRKYLTHKMLVHFVKKIQSFDQPEEEPHKKDLSLDGMVRSLFQVWHEDESNYT